MSSPLVSVYIPTRNRRELLRRAVESVLGQSYPAIEILVADDASDDGTEAMMRSWAAREPRLRYLRIGEPSGANVARNRAIRAARGVFVTGLDDDDIMLPERVEKLVTAYRDDLAFVTSRYYVEDGRRRRIRPRVVARRIRRRDLLYANIVGNQVFAPRRRFVEAGLFDETLPAAQDIDMWIRMLGEGEAEILPEPLQIVRGNGDGITASTERRREGYRRVYRKHRHLMSRDQRRYKLFAFALAAPRPSLRRAWRLIPRHPRYTLVALLQWSRALMRQRALGPKGVL